MTVPDYCIVCDRQFAPGHPHPGHDGRLERSPRLPLPVVLGALWVLAVLAGAGAILVEVFR